MYAQLIHFIHIYTGENCIHFSVVLLGLAKVKILHCWKNNRSFDDYLWAKL